MSVQLPENSAGLMIDMEHHEGGRYARIGFTPDEARRILAIVHSLGERAEAKPIGDSCYGPRAWIVQLKSVNARTGNFHLFEIKPESGLTEKKIKALVRQAKKERTAKDNATRRYIAVEKQINNE